MKLRHLDKLEECTCDGELIGWRIHNGNVSSLIWADQKLMDGIRVGDHFTLEFNKTIEYKTLYDRYGTVTK